nr:hypothetical protein [uncultured Campylobacter sp.]
MAVRREIDAASIVNIALRFFAAASEFKPPKTRGELNLDKVSATIKFRSVKIYRDFKFKAVCKFLSFDTQILPYCPPAFEFALFYVHQNFKSSSHKILFLRHINFVGSHFYAKEKIIKRS